MDFRFINVNRNIRNIQKPYAGIIRSLIASVKYSQALRYQPQHIAA